MFERGAPRDPLEAALFGDFFGDGPGAFGLLPFAGRRAGPPGRKRGPCGPAACRRLALDVAEHEGSYEISADLPGVKRGRSAGGGPRRRPQAEREPGRREEGAVRGRGGEPSATRRGAGRGAAGGRGGPRG